MLKLLGVASVVVLVLSIFVAVQDKRATERHRQQREDSSKPANPPTIPKPQKEQPDNDDYNPKRDTPSWYGVVRWPEGITTCALLLTLVALVEQTRQTAIAAKATQAAAVASLKQVGLMEVQNKAAQDKERARLFIDFPPESPSLRGLRIVDKNGDETLMVNVVLKVFNNGDTKAFNVRASGYSFTGPMELGKIYPSSGTSFRVQTIIGVADAEHPVFVPVASAPFGDYILMPSQDWDHLQNGDKGITVIGTIDYEDVFGIAHQTPFHFEWGVTRDRGFGYSAAWRDQSSAMT